MSHKAAAPALVLQGTHDKWEMILDAKAVASLLGDDVLPHFYRCFVAVDRVVTLEQLLFLNAQHLKEDSVAQSRNLHHLVLLLAGAMYEAGSALQGLTSTPFGKMLQQLVSWGPLNTMRAEWNKEDFASTIRSGFAHHFGEIDKYRIGIENGPATVVLEAGEGSLLFDSRFVAPWNALFEGENIDDVQMASFVRKSRDAHRNLPDLVLKLFHDVLAAYGVLMRDERIA